MSIRKAVQKLSEKDRAELNAVADKALAERDRLRKLARDRAKVTITLTRGDAERIKGGLADVLCWVRGFRAACPDDTERHPLGVPETRDIADRLTAALNDPEEMPF